MGKHTDDLRGRVQEAVREIIMRLKRDHRADRKVDKAKNAADTVDEEARELLAGADDTPHVDDSSYPGIA
jgi:hypothetical protein